MSNYCYILSFVSHFLRTYCSIVCLLWQYICLEAHYFNNRWCLEHLLFCKISEQIRVPWGVRHRNRCKRCKKMSAPLFWTLKRLTHYHPMVTSLQIDSSICHGRITAVVMIHCTVTVSVLQYIVRFFSGDIDADSYNRSDVLYTGIVLNVSLPNTLQIKKSICLISIFALFSSKNI